MGPRPLLGQLPRSLLGVAFGLACPFVLVGTVVTFAWLFAPLFALVAVVAAGCSLVVSVVALMGAWSPRPALRAAQLLAAATLGASLVVLGAASAVADVDRPVHLVLVGGCASGLAALLAVLPVRRSALRGAAGAFAGALVLVAAGTGLAAGAVVVTDDGDGGCDAFRFDAARWSSLRAAAPHALEDPGETTELERLAGDLARCATLTGLTRHQVRTLLGPPDTGSRTTWSYVLGTTNDAYGPGDQHLLSLTFRAGHLTSATT
ncbi:hypothetical protein [Conexibacter sp. SYSU D00693]|uniref:hypothetical protein n=1 Tax=Conexibacter sp. SYSU D00693 TaxID=2812560 RepID=UPI00196B2BCB|nr:hypothetical protein [Conexibacter sp. SYSU D00693]